MSIIQAGEYTKLQKEKLSDGSVVYNVIVFEDYAGIIEVKIPAINLAAAKEICETIEKYSC